VPRRTTIASAMRSGCAGGEGRFVAAHDLVRGLSYLWRSDDVLRGGWRVALDGYEARVYVDVREWVDHDGVLASLHASLGERGVPSLEDALDDLRFAGTHEPLTRLVTAWREGGDAPAAWADWVAALATPATPAPARAPRGSEARLEAAVGLPASMASAYVHAAAHLPDARGTWARTRIGRTVARDLAAAGFADASAWAAAASAAIATLPAPSEPWPDDAALAATMAAAPALLRLLDVHEHGGTRWFRQEGFERWLDVMWAAGRRQRPGAGPARALAGWRRRWAARMRASGYRWAALLEDAGRRRGDRRPRWCEAGGPAGSPRRNDRRGAPTRVARAPPAARPRRRRGSAGSAARTAPDRRGRSWRGARGRRVGAARGG
jgi:hypothetical protein